MKNTNESGRSMVEMLGVLAIIGVLSIGGIAGYTMAMNKFRANEIIGAVVQAAIDCRTRGRISNDITARGLSFANGGCQGDTEGIVGYTATESVAIAKMVCKGLAPYSNAAATQPAECDNIANTATMLYFKPES